MCQRAVSDVCCDRSCCHLGAHHLAICTRHEREVLQVLHLQRRISGETVTLKIFLQTPIAKICFRGLPPLASLLASMNIVVLSVGYRVSDITPLSNSANERKRGGVISCARQCMRSLHVGRWTERPLSAGFILTLWSSFCQRRYIVYTYGVLISVVNSI